MHIQKPQKIFIGSTNPVKINAVRLAIAHMWSDVEVFGINVPSGINEQPFGDHETRTGAQNRAKAVLRAAKKQKLFDSKNELVLGVGLEGGVLEFEGEIWSTVWAEVCDSKKLQFFEANGARFRMPTAIAERLRAGDELGPLLSQMFAGADVKRTTGAIGILTDNFVDRTQEYSAIIKLAIGLWHGRHVESDLAERAARL